MSSLNKQIGGAHYKGRKMQPVELWAELGLNGFQASILKYITRHREKNGDEDLRKALHFYDLGHDLGVWSAPWWKWWKLQPRPNREQRRALMRYATANQITPTAYRALAVLFEVNLNGDKAAREAARVKFHDAVNSLRVEAGYIDMWTAAKLSPGVG